MRYETLRETELYRLTTTKLSSQGILVRIQDKAICRLSGEDTAMLAQLDDDQDFNTVSHSFKFMGFILEK